MNGKVLRRASLAEEFGGLEEPRYAFIPAEGGIMGGEDPEPGSE